MKSNWLIGRKTQAPTGLQTPLPHTQKSFHALNISEKAKLLQEEIIEIEKSGCPLGRRAADVVAQRHSMGGRTVSRLLRVNHLISHFRHLVDEGKLSIHAAAQLSYLNRWEQGDLVRLLEEFPRIHLTIMVCEQLHQMRKEGRWDREAILKACTLPPRVKPILIPRNRLPKQMRELPDQEVVAHLLGLLAQQKD